MGTISGRGEAAHPNAQLVERLYASLRDRDPRGARDCYADDAHFEDIAFRLHSGNEIFEMWRFVCGRDLQVSFDSIVADDENGSGRWIAGYTISDNMRKVKNVTISRFRFRKGRIIEHVDRSDAMAWAAQAYPFPKSVAAGLIGPLRRWIAHRKLREFIRLNPEG